MPPQRTVDRTRPRQDPVSCQLCRSKKLKCDRQRPCANCNSRGLSCEYQGEAPVSIRDESLLKDDDLREENRAIKARLRQLEQAVFGAQIPSSVAVSTHTSPLSAASSVLHNGDNDKETNASYWLVGLESELKDLPDYSDLPEYRLCSVDEMLATARRVATKRPVWLPTEDVAMQLFDIYTQKLESVQHIMHVPTVHQMFCSIYADLNVGKAIHPGSLALMLAICAGSALYWTDELYHGRPFQNEQTSSQIAHIWIKEGLKALEQVRLRSSPTLESVQGAILVSFLLYHTEGFSARARILQSSIASMARDLGLHKIDAPGARPEARTQAEVISREVERKTWWHLACTDWLLSYIGGPYEGVYSIHPRHMKVDLPRNLNHHDLGTRGPGFSRSLTEPTVMSYYLHRIKLATICREVVDTLWDGPVLQPEHIIYDSVIALDGKFDAMLDELPPYLRLDKTSRQLQGDYSGFDIPTLLLQRIIINLMIQSFRCKMHTRFLIRCKSDERFSYSRLRCLNAARAVLQTRNVFKESKELIFAAHSKNCGVVQHFFYASMVFIMDLCINDPEDPSRKTEIREALALIEESTASSKMAKQFFDSATDLLRKNKVKLPGVSSETHQVAPRQIPTGLESAIGPASSFPASTTALDPLPLNVDDLSMDFSFQFDSMWQEVFEQTSHLDYQGWDSLMNDLGARVL